MQIINISKNRLVVLTLLLALVLVLVFSPPLRTINGHYIAKAQLNEGFHIFSDYNNMQKNKKTCPVYNKKHIALYKYIKDVHTIYNRKESECYLVVTMKKNGVDKRIQDKSLLFNIDFKNNTLHCYSNIDEDNRYLIENYNKCSFILSEKIITSLLNKYDLPSL